MIALLTLWSLFDIFVFIYVTATLDPDLSIDYIRLFVLTAICGHLTWITACGLIIIKLLVDFLKITSNWVNNKTTAIERHSNNQDGDPYDW